MNASVNRPATTTAPTSQPTARTQATTTGRYAVGGRDPCIQRRPRAATGRPRSGSRPAAWPIRKNRVFWYGEPARKTRTRTGQPTSRTLATRPPDARPRQRPRRRAARAARTSTARRAGRGRRPRSGSHGRAGRRSCRRWCAARSAGPSGRRRNRPRTGRSVPRAIARPIGRPDRREHDRRRRSARPRPPPIAAHRSRAQVRRSPTSATIPIGTATSPNTQRVSMAAAVSAAASSSQRIRPVRTNRQTAHAPAVASAIDSVSDIATALDCQSWPGSAAMTRGQRAARRPRPARPAAARRPRRRGGR